MNATKKAKLDMEKEMKELRGNDSATSSKDCTPQVAQQDEKGFPKFSRFSTEEPKPKSEATFEEWMYEVIAAQDFDCFSEQVMAQTIRKSLTSQEKRVIIPMGTKATVKEILVKLEKVFGNVVTGDCILEVFHSAVQKQDECVVD